MRKVSLHENYGKLVLSVEKLPARAFEYRTNINITIPR